MKLVLGFVFLLLIIIPISIEAQILPPEAHQRFLEEGYSDFDILFFVLLSIVGIVIAIAFLVPKIRNKKS